MSARAVVRTLAVLGLAAAAAVPAASAVAAPVPAVASGRAAAASAPAAVVDVSWRDVPTGSTEQFRGLSAVNGRVAWVSGTGGTVLRTVDHGRTWQDVSPGGDTATLQFRDVEAISAERAVVLSIGPGGDSRVYRTTDGGQTWRRTFRNADPAAFYDCMGFWDDRNGLALSDPVDGRFRVLRTGDGGASWSVVDPAGMPAALPGEFAFAASGTCLVTAGRGSAWIASGGGATSRVFHSTDRGRTWTVSSTPVASSAAGGIFSLAVRGTREVVAVGGDFTVPDVGTDAAAWSSNGGRTWTAGGALGGYRSGAAWLRQVADGAAPVNDAVVAVGPTGTDLSNDGGRTWTPVDTGSLDSVDCTPRGACWGSGADGRVARLQRR
jgi:photosystem II stability/assembly factor-like uncharacterized protein